MFKENLDVIDAIANLQDKYDWPKFIGCSTGKNNKAVVIEGAGRLRSNSMTLAASVQSLDLEVLSNIKRSNISSDDIVDMAMEGTQSGQQTYSEVIACLPGDTLSTFMQTIEKLVNSGLTIIKTHTLLLVHGTDLYDRQSRKKFGFKTRFRAVTKSFGNYEFNNEDFFSVEEEEIVIETNSLPYKDYLECRRLQLSVQLFYNDDLFKELHAVLKYLKIPIWEWLLHIHKKLDKENGEVLELYNGYMSEVESELWETSGAMRDHVRCNLDAYIDGRIGNNVTYKYRAMLLQSYVPIVMDIGYVIAKQLVNSKYENAKHSYNDYMDDLQQISLLRKRNIFDTSVGDNILHIGFKLESDTLDASSFLPLEEKILVRVDHDSKQKEFLIKHFLTHDNSLLELASLLNRIPASNLYRKVSLVNA